jgi:hypothetical protein
LLGQRTGQSRLAIDGFSGRGITRRSCDLFDAEAYVVDVDASGFQPDDDLVHEQRELLSPARGSDVHRQFATALGSRLGACGNPFTDDLPPLFAINGRPGVTRGRLARTRQERA